MLINLKDIYSQPLSDSGNVFSLAGQKDQSDVYDLSNIAYIQAESSIDHVGTKKVAILVMNDEFFKNHYWSNKSNTTTITWQLTTAPNSILGTPVTGLVFGDVTTANFQTAVIPDLDSDFGEPQVLGIFYDEDCNNKADPTSGVFDQGQYWVKAVVEEEESYKDYSAAERIFEITISQKPIDQVISIESVDYSEDDGGPSAHNPLDYILVNESKYDPLGNYEFTISSVESVSEVNSEGYRVTVTLDSNYTWNESQEAGDIGQTLTLVFRINQVQNSIHLDDLINHATYGDESYPLPDYDLKYKNNADISWEYYVEGEWVETVPEHAGDYRIRAVVASTNNFSECTSNEVEFSVNPRPVSLPSIDDLNDDADGNFTYTGSSFSATDYWVMNDEWSKSQGFDSVFEIVNDSEHTSVVSETIADVYTIYVKPNKDHCWVGEVSEDQSIKGISWSISKRTVYLYYDPNIEENVRTIAVLDYDPETIGDRLLTGFVSGGETISGIGLNDIESWPTEVERGKVYHVTLVLDDTTFQNNVLAVNHQYDSSYGNDELNSDEYAEGQALTIYFAVVGSTYSLSIGLNNNVGGQPGAIYTGAEFKPDLRLESIDPNVGEDLKGYINNILEDINGGTYTNLTYYSVDDPSQSLIPIDAGKYILRFTIPAEGDFGAHDVTLEFNIFQKKIESTIDEELISTTYDGTDQLEKLKSNFDGLVDADNAKDLVKWTFYLDNLDGQTELLKLIDATLNDFGEVESIKIHYLLEAGENYLADEGTFTIQVAPASLTIGVEGEFEYDYTGTEIELDVSATDFTGLASTDAENDVVVAFNTTETPIDVGSYTLAFYTTNPNYVLDLASDSPSSISILPIELDESFVHYTIYKDSKGWYEYDGESHTAFDSYYVDTGDEYPDQKEDFEWTVEVTDSSGNIVQKICNAGTYKVSFEIKSDNFVQFIKDVYVEIVPKSLTITIGDYDVIYGEAFNDSSIKPDYDGFVSGESQENLGWDLSWIYNYDKGEDVTTVDKPIKLTVDGMDDDRVLGNYRITVKDGSLSVIERSISVTLTDCEIIYGESLGDTLYSEDYCKVAGLNVSEPFVDGHSISSVLKLYVDGDTPLNAGPYQILYMVLNKNYDVIVNTATLTVQPRPLSATFDASNLTYNGMDQGKKIDYIDEAPDGFSCHLEFRSIEDADEEDGTIRLFREKGAAAANFVEIAAEILCGNADGGWRFLLQIDADFLPALCKQDVFLHKDMPPCLVSSIVSRLRQIVKRESKVRVAGENIPVRVLCRRFFE